jgi:GGDEF domain-containing protein
MDQSPLCHVFDVYRVRPGDEGAVARNLVGRVMSHDGGNVEVLADFYGYLRHLGEQNGVRAWTMLQRNPYFEIVSREDMRNGLRPDLIREAPLSLPEEDPNADVEVPNPEEAAKLYQPPSVFEYHHSALKQPVEMEVRNGQTYFNGFPLSPQEQALILRNVNAGLAKIRYKRSGPQAVVAKMETMFRSLSKIEPHLSGALDQVRAAVKAGHLHPDVLKHLTQEIFVDPMVKGVGNKKAYADFLTRPKPGVHIRMDGNDFGSINKIHSFEHGNQAITAMGQAMRESMDEAVGRQHGKLFRIGGDEFHAHVPSPEHAAKFARTLRSKLEKIAPIGGTHNLSVSMGFAHDPEAADQASIQAKQAKKAKGYQIGQAKTHAYSALPGSEGHVPLDTEQLPLASPHAAGVAEKPAGGPPTTPEAPAAPTAAAPTPPQVAR